MREPVKMWEDCFDGSISEETIRRKFVPPERYRISKCVYPIFTQFQGAMGPCTLFVLGGSCSHTFKGNAHHTSTNEFTTLPGGDYSFCVTSNTEATIVLVWDLIE